MTTALELGEVQGLILSSYGDRPAAVYAVFRIDERARAQRWLARLVQDDRVQFAEFLSTPREQEPKLHPMPLNVAFTHAGLEALGLPEEALAGFLDAFKEGMATASRARQLGDDGESAPDKWRWGSTGPTVHGVLAAFGGTGGGTPEDIAALEAVMQSELTKENGIGWMKILPALLLRADQTEHFGFRDGISNPGVEGAPNAGKATELLAAGEFLLGYPNGYQQVGLTPRVRSEGDPDGILVDAGDGTHDFGRNGSFLVFRQLEQKVDAFNSWVNATAKAHGMSPDWVGAKLVGRWKNGRPLTLNPDGPGTDPLEAPVHFLYSEHKDATGARCPIGSHIRRSNPRDTMLPEPHDEPLSGDPHVAATRKARLELTNRRRILRRGRIYDVDGEKGLYFLCFNGNLRRQFEFVQSMWSVNPNFAGLESDPDPFLGARRKIPYEASQFTLQGSDGSPPRTFENLERFVEMRGGAYFFMPGKRSLRFLARATPPVEAPAAGEREDAEASAELHSNKVKKQFEAQTVLRPHAVRGFHVKSHGILRAKVTVRHDLPTAYRHGVFARPGRTYDAWVRVSSSAFGTNPDTKSDVHGIALKLMGVEGERPVGGFERQTQDFLLIDSPYLMVGTIASALPFDRANVEGTLALLRHLASHPAEALRLVRMLKTPSNPLAGTYSSVTPFRLGPTKIVRWGMRAAAGVELVEAYPSINQLRDALRAQLRRGDIPLELCVEVRGAGNQPIDDGSVDWQGSVERIADVLLLREGFDTPEQETAGERMSFNPWNALAAHRPLGNLNRARQVVYRAVYEMRTRLNEYPPFEPVPTG